MSREGALWIGGLEAYMDEDFLNNAMKMMGEENVVSIKVIKNKFTGEPASYGFINFDSDPSALMAMHKLNGKIIPNSQPPVRFKLNHNSTRLMPGEKDHSIWVGDLTPDVDDLQMFRFFSARFQSIKSAKVVLDASGFSKGYGFIRFGNEQEQQTALISMMGVAGLGGKPIKVSLAVAKPKDGTVPGIPTNATSAGVAGNLSDTLPSSALAMVVSNASGNPKAGEKIVADAQTAEYNAYWQKYSQHYWSQYAAWSQYSQQYQQQQAPPPPPPQQQYEGYDPQSYSAYTQQSAAPQPEVASSEGKTSRDPNQSIFEGDELDLVDHVELLDGEVMNMKYLGKSEEFWDTLENTFWCLPQEIQPNRDIYPKFDKENGESKSEKLEQKSS